MKKVLYILPSWKVGHFYFFPILFYIHNRVSTCAKLFIMARPDPAPLETTMVISLYEPIRSVIIRVYEHYIAMNIYKYI